MTNLKKKVLQKIQMMSCSVIFCDSLCARCQTEDLLSSGHWTSSLSTADGQQYNVGLNFIAKIMNK